MKLLKSKEMCYLSLYVFGNKLSDWFEAGFGVLNSQSGMF